MRSLRLASLSALLAEDPQVPIAETLAVDWLDILRRRAAKFPEFKGPGIAYAVALFTADMLARMAPDRERFDIWIGVVREEWESKRAEVASQSETAVKN